jgi:hypothetical protein
VNVVPQLVAGLVVGSDFIVPAKPLNESGATPPERLLSGDQESFHQFRVVVGAAALTVLLPSTNAPLLGNEKTMIGSLSDEPR